MLTPNNEKTIIIGRCACLNVSKEKGMRMLCEFRSYIEQQFNPKETDDSVAIIVIPSDYWDIEIYNPKTDEMTKQYVEELLEQYKEQMK